MNEIEEKQKDTKKTKYRRPQPPFGYFDQKDNKVKDSYPRLIELLNLGNVEENEVLKELERCKDKINQKYEFLDHPAIQFLYHAQNIKIPHPCDDDPNAGSDSYLIELEDIVPKDESGEFNFEKHPVEKMWLDKIVGEENRAEERYKELTELKMQVLSWLIRNDL